MSSRGKTPMALAEEAREHILERLVTGNKARATEYTL
jgi:hypothetical protein